MKMQVLNEIKNAIKCIDSVAWGINYGEQKQRINTARANLINIIFSEGFELSRNYRVVKQTTKRELIKF